jgi:hypothetical protein
MKSINQRLAEELVVQEWQVTAAVELIDSGATVPFIARYRKEVTGTLDDTQLRNLDERLSYLRELEDRRTAVIESIREQGKLADQGAPRGHLSSLQAEAPHESADCTGGRTAAAGDRSAGSSDVGPARRG